MTESIVYKFLVSEFPKSLKESIISISYEEKHIIDILNYCKTFNFESNIRNEILTLLLTIACVNNYTTAIIIILCIENYNIPYRELMKCNEIDYDTIITLIQLKKINMRK